MTVFQQSYYKRSIDLIQFILRFFNQFIIILLLCVSQKLKSKVQEKVVQKSKMVSSSSPNKIFMIIIYFKKMSKVNKYWEQGALASLQKLSTKKLEKYLLSKSFKRIFQKISWKQFQIKSRSFYNSNIKILSNSLKNFNRILEFTQYQDIVKEDNCLTMLKREENLNRKKQSKLWYKQHKLFNIATAKNLYTEILNQIIFFFKIIPRILQLSQLILDARQNQRTAKNQKIQLELQQFYFIQVFYMAPQVINQSYDASCDIWSLGIILYILLTGYPPYYGQTQQEILDMIKQSNYTFQVDQNEKLSVQALDLLSKCLTTPEKRITATQILKHKWFTEILKDENLNE